MACFFTLFSLLCLFQKEVAYAQRPAKPNIIYILADDLGYADLGCFGSKRIKTPHLDQMAAEGIKLTRHYSTGVCAPSRACLITGKHLGHCEIRGNRQAPTGYGQLPLSDTATTVAMLLKGAGYATALVGKWGLGEPGTTGDPLKKGFDHYFGYTDQVLAHNHFPEYLLRNGEKIFLKNEVQYQAPDSWAKGRGSVSTKKVEFSQDYFSKEVSEFIHKNRKQPFFLYYTPIIPHDNGEAPLGEQIESPTTEPYTQMNWSEDEKRYAASITYLDREIGKLLAQLKKEGLDKKTLVMFVSDNGPKQRDAFESTGGLRGKKRDMYEGGIRVPFIARWPGQIKAGRVNETPSALWDFLPTACALAGIKQPHTDGVSLLPILFNKMAPKREYLYWELFDGGDKQAVLMGQWKAIRNGLKVGQPIPPLELYDLQKDPQEQNNVAAEFPDVVKTMETLMRKAHLPSKIFPLPLDQ